MDNLVKTLIRLLEFPLIIGNEGELHCNYDQKHCENSFFLEGSSIELTYDNITNQLMDHINTNHSEWWLS